jgi:hypothetical protein
MKFLHLFHKEVEFGNIEGYDDIKDIVRRALDACTYRATRRSNSYISRLKSATGCRRRQL